MVIFYVDFSQNLLNQYESTSKNDMMTTNRSSHRRCSARKGILRISQNSQEDNCPTASFLIKLQAEALLYAMRSIHSSMSIMN